jgi:hypothetical protein
MDATRPWLHQTYELAWASVYPAMVVPAAASAARRIDARMSPKTVLVTSPAKVASR